MSGQRWSNAILESDWLALWLAIFRRANKTADKMPALAQQMIAIWDVDRLRKIFLKLYYAFYAFHYICRRLSHLAIYM